MIFIVSLVIGFLGLPRFWPIVGVVLVVLYFAYIASQNDIGVCVFVYTV
jgi:hypothetical protein